MGGDPGAEARARRERQAAALRANLRRRKQQARDRVGADRSENGDLGNGRVGADTAAPDRPDEP